MLKNIFDWFGSNLKKKSCRALPKHASGQSRQLRHEHLEDRRMLATLTVNVSYDSAAIHVFNGTQVDHVVVPNDNGSLTLREAMAVVNGDYTPDTNINGDILQIDGDVGVPGVIDKIQFALPSGEDTITLGIDENGNNIDFPTIPGFPGLDITGEIEINRSVIIDAQGQGIIVDATANDDNVNVDEGGGSRVFGIGLTGEVAQGTSIDISNDVTLAGLTIKGGDTTDDGGGVEFNFSPFQQPGNISNNGGSLTIRDSVIVDNHAGGRGGGVSIITSQVDSGVVLLDFSRSTIAGNSAGGTGNYGGGGIYADLDGNGSDNEGIIFNLTDSTVSDNSTLGNGGGIWLCAKGGGTFNATNSTISGNTAGNLGGGMWIGRSGNQDMVSNLAHVTITDNSATSGGGLYSDNIQHVITSLTHTIVSGNRVALDPASAANNIAGGIDADSAYNFIGTSTAALPTGPGNITTNADDPGLMPLAYYGGPTKTHKPLDTSPVIDAGDPSFSAPPEFDQRGFQRIQDIVSVPLAGRGPVDIGAVEVHSLAPIITEVVISKSNTNKRHSYYDVVKINDPGDALGNQIRALTFSEADTISITFSEDVNVDNDALSVRSINQILEYHMVDVSYDSNNFTKTWELSQNSNQNAPAQQSFGQNNSTSAADHVLIMLDSNDVTAVSGGTELDGEWINPNALNPVVNTDAISRFPSGDGVEGGDFHFVFTSYIAGDFDNDNFAFYDDADLVFFNLGASEQDGIPGWVTEFAGDDGIITYAELSLLAVNFADDFTELNLLGDLDENGIVDWDDYFNSNTLVEEAAVMGQWNLWFATNLNPNPLG